MNKARISSLLIISSLLLLTASMKLTLAQHQGHSMPGMTMPSPTPKPSASPKMQPSPESTHVHEAPAASTSPPENPTQQMSMPMPAASPSPSTGGMENMQMGNEPAGAVHSANVPDLSSTIMDMGPVLSMSGNQMFIRVGNRQLIPMGQMGSGTSWNPASTPTYMYHKISGDWLLMFHFNATAGVNRQGGSRGDTSFESQNWFMPMAFHRLGRGTIELRGMFSAEPFTFPRGGAPLLFQTGESFRGLPLVDHQHPHDLFMELSATYTMPIGEHAAWFAYLGYPGEPALGPAAFMHRWSALENPSATLAHHLQDSTHISFGVFTTGVTYRWFKLEGSLFNGREPDENRYNFEAHPWNSRSARLSFAPNMNWTMQLSYGFLRSPEELEPNTDIRRATASVQYNRPFNRGNWGTAFIWGRNHQSAPGEVQNLNGYTFESTVNFLERNYLYTRLEWVDKNELLNALERAALGINEEHPLFRIGAYTVGATREIWNTESLSLAVGSDLTFYTKPTVLDTLYGNAPVSWRLFFRLRPAKMSMSGMHDSTHQHSH